MYRRVDSQIIREDIPVVKDEPLKRQLASFVDCVKIKGQPVVTGASAADALQVAARIIDLIWKDNPFVPPIQS